MADVEQIAYIAGMPRAGTTFLYHNLQKHPHIHVPFRRKSNFFSLHHDKPVAWFLEHFKDVKPDQVGIDTDTLFFVDKTLESYKNFHQLNPNAKVMLFVRTPSEWAWSLYKQIATFDKNIISFKDFLDGKYVLVEDGKELTFNISNGDVEKIIKSLMQMFKGNMLIIDFRLLKKNPFLMLQAIESFLEIPKFFTEDNFDNQKINANERGSFLFLASLLRKAWLINLLNKLPRRVVIFIRRIYDRFGSMTLKKQNSDEGSVCDELLIAKQAYSGDDNYVRELFYKSQILMP